MRNGFSRSVFAFFLCLVSLKAQQSGTISGTVTDQVGKAIPTATVEVRNEATGVARAVTTDDNGRFAVPDLAVGSYSIAVASPGFALTPRSGGKISAGATLDVPIAMSVESVATSITVNESISLAAAT